MIPLNIRFRRGFRGAWPYQHNFLRNSLVELHNLKLYCVCIRSVAYVSGPDPNEGGVEAEIRIHDGSFGAGTTVCHTVAGTPPGAKASSTDFLGSRFHSTKDFRTLHLR